MCFFSNFELAKFSQNGCYKTFFYLRKNKLERFWLERNLSTRVGAHTQSGALNGADVADVQVRLEISSHGQTL